jgi:hypothetical protein
MNVLLLNNVYPPFRRVLFKWGSASHLTWQEDFIEEICLLDQKKSTRLVRRTLIHLKK